MIGKLRRLWHSRDWMLIPLGGLTLLVIGALAILWSGADLPFDGREPYDPPRYETTWQIVGGDADAEPTVGMRLGEGGLGTVTQAPAVLAEQAPLDTPIGRWDLPIVQPDVARFVRAFPVRRWLNPPVDGMITCTAEGPPVFRGKLVLRDGCLLFEHEERSKADAIALVGGGNLFRDPEGYLAFGLREGFAEWRLRVGEEGGHFEGAGCSQPAYLRAPPKLARTCGANRMINIATVKRVPICSAASLEYVEREVQEAVAVNTRLAEQNAACRAANGPNAPCPPTVAPPPLGLFDSRCRIPEPIRRRLLQSLQPSQGSSTQPKPSR